MPLGNGRAKSTSTALSTSCKVYTRAHLIAHPLNPPVAVANQMKNQSPQGGSIVGISSISALVGGAMQCHYTPTKAAILSLMQSCAVALGQYNIRANAILPGTIATDINKDDLSNAAKRENMEKRTCLGRLGGVVCSISFALTSPLLSPLRHCWTRGVPSQRLGQVCYRCISFG